MTERVKLQLWDYRSLRLLKLSPFERRPRGGWRFGTKTIADSVVARLVAAGRAEIRGNQVVARRNAEAGQ